ncbi:hypothetical protein DHEL01_v212053 [Diaporthe helianthi]|uniref:Uncharacterized protein n=1 Tax=Diaporthe helianthi TaxID=158607 RepID=A0A2P5HH33_DIAHE|nr:hypothetical protein DHEL01_v212053 [Diaporthe helianthi]
MHKPDLDARIAGPSRDELVKIVGDLAADPAVKGKVVSAVDMARSLAKEEQPSTRPSLFDRISNGFRRKPKAETLTMTSTTSSETLTEDRETPRKRSTANLEEITPKPKAVKSDIQESW